MMLFWLATTFKRANFFVSTRRRLRSETTDLPFFNPWREAFVFTQHATSISGRSSSAATLLCLWLFQKHTSIRRLRGEQVQKLHGWMQLSFRLIQKDVAQVSKGVCGLRNIIVVFHNVRWRVNGKRNDSWRTPKLKFMFGQVAGANSQALFEKQIQPLRWCERGQIILNGVNM